MRPLDSGFVAVADVPIGAFLKVNVGWWTLLGLGPLWYEDGPLVTGDLCSFRVCLEFLRMDRISKTK